MVETWIYIDAVVVTKDHGKMLVEVREVLVE
jgi:hypothetical protein